MKKNKLFVSIGLTVILFLFISGKSDMSYTHEPSGAYFPEEIGNFSFYNQNNYDNTGNDISVSYRSINGSELTHYVYPVYENSKKLTFLRHFNSYKNSITQTYEGCELVEESDFENEKFSGKFAVFTFSINFRGKVQQVYSWFLLFEESDWFMKLRVTFAVTCKEECEAELLGYVSQMPWPTKPYEL